MKRRIVSTLCALSLALCMTSPALAADYTDVKDGAWYAGAVQTVTDKGLMNGTSAAAFAPSAYVTRATAVTVLWRLDGCPEPVSQTGFPDVAAGSWCDKAVRWARETQIADGYSDGTFGVNDPVTREQLALFFSRYTYYRGHTLAQGVLSLYPDGDKVSPWAVDGMKHAVGAGLITGTSAGTLSPLGYTTRAELAVILVRFMTPAAG